MSFEVIATEPFERKLKKLAKKHKSLKTDLAIVVDQLADSPDLGTPLGKDCYKIRMTVTSKGKGKSGGARLITYVTDVTHWESKLYLSSIKAALNELNAIKYGLQLQLEF